MKNLNAFLRLCKTALLLACLLVVPYTGFACSEDHPDAHKVVEVKRRGKVVITTVYNQKTGKKWCKMKVKKGALVYKVTYNDRGRIISSTNRKGHTRMHPEKCNCK